MVTGITIQQHTPQVLNKPETPTDQWYSTIFVFQEMKSQSHLNEEQAF